MTIIAVTTHNIKSSFELHPETNQRENQWTRGLDASQDGQTWNELEVTCVDPQPPNQW